MKKKHLLIIPLLTLTLSGCDFKNFSIKNILASLGFGERIDDGPELESISLSLDTLTIKVGETYTLEASFIPTGVMWEGLTWRSDNTSVATVNNGVVTGINAGSAKIFAEVSGKSAYCEVTVTKQNEEEEDIHVTSVSLNKTTLSLVEGESETLVETVLPANAEDKTVSWESSKPLVASVEAGVVKAWSEGNATITVKTNDGNKTATCQVSVTKKESEKTLIKKTFNASEQGYTFSQKSLVNDPIAFEGYTISFAVGANTYNNQPSLIKAGKKYEARIYWGNTFTITSPVETLTRVEFTLGANDKGNAMSASTGDIVDGAWVGSAKEITFSVSGTSGYRAFECFTLCYEGQTEDDPETVINLGNKTIKEVKEYIAEHPVNKNAFGNGVNEKRYVTIEGMALAKIDLIKYTANYGLDVSEHGKVIVGDETGVIGCATVVNSLGTSLWGKVSDYVCKPTSKYRITGYISEYLGNPELLVTSFEWDQNISLNIDYSKVTSETASLERFYEMSNSVQYNCAGHGYGEVVTIKNLLCYYMEPDGQGKRYYNFTDGTRNIRVNAFNISNATVGNVYDVTGIISLKNLSPIIVAFEIKSSTAEVNFDYENIAQNISITDLKKIKGSQEDTMERYPDVVNAYGNIYKTTGYLTAVEENGKLYVGISDNFINRKDLITGKDNAMANYGVSLIKNDNFWNTTEVELYLFNPTFDEYLLEDNPITVYYVVRQQRYSKDKPMWEILLLPQFIESLSTTVE